MIIDAANHIAVKQTVPQTTMNYDMGIGYALLV